MAIISLDFLKDFNKEIEKLEDVGTSSIPPRYWYPTGNYVLNKIISGDFKKGIPQGRITNLAGPSGCLPAGEKVRVYKMKTIINQTPTVKSI